MAACSPSQRLRQNRTVSTSRPTSRAIWLLFRPAAADRMILPRRANCWGVLYRRTRVSNPCCSSGDNSTTGGFGPRIAFTTTLHLSNLNALIILLGLFSPPVLVLQESPLAPILDLGSVSRPVDTETQAGQVVQSWINVQTQLAVSQTAESRTQATVRHRVENLRQIYLGHPDALQDSRLFDYFVRTKEFEDAVEARRTIFIGRRGSGKSANFQAIKEELRQRPGIVTSEIAPDDFELERISDFLERGYSLTNQRYVFQNVWNYVIVTELLKSLDQDTDKLYLSPDDTLRSNLHEYYESNRQLGIVPFRGLTHPPNPS